MKPESFQPSLTEAFVAEAMGLVLPGTSSSHIFSSVTIDSRKVPAGSLFVAIPGDQFDGHDFIAQAVAAGATGIVHRRDLRPEPAHRVKFFPVDDTREAYRRLAQAWRKEFMIPVACVAGSVGKTTTKELLAALLEGKWPGKVLKTQGSQNGFVGIPLTLLSLRPSHGAAVIEVGIDEPDTMEKHLRTVAPGAALLTAIGAEHLEKLRDIPTVAREEGLALVHVARAGGLVAINLDDPWIRPHAATLHEGRKIAFSLSGTPLPEKATDFSDAEILRGKLSADRARMELSGMGLDGISVPLPLPGEHNARNLLGALALARGLGLADGELLRGLESFRGADGRSEVRELPGGATVLCDYYNSNPASLAAGLDVLQQLARGRPRWACLGDMLELGPDEERFHREVAAPLAALGIERILLYGPRMKALHDELGKRGLGARVAHYDSHAALAQALQEGLRASPRSAVLIKGSRGMKMEEVWKALGG